MKHCNNCNLDLDESQFAKNKAKKDGLQTICTKCRKVWWDIHYKGSKDYYVKRNRVKRDITAGKFKAYKATLNCKVCGENETCCLDFHHLDPTKKDLSVSRMISRHAWETIQSEISKCVALCANCHRKLHNGIIKLGV